MHHLFRILDRIANSTAVLAVAFALVIISLYYCVTVLVGGN